MDHQDQLNNEDFEMILTSLEYTKQAFANYKDYPSLEFKQKRIADVDTVIKKVKALRQEMKSQKK